ncbi:MAG: acetate--CoA ligase family protein [Patescibacteria group bacterium]|nr:acetate--CoA ligase family protein [Patescibacteria group bacterium]
MFDLKSLLSPRTIAVVGASTRPASVGRTVFDNLRLSGFKGKIFPVNPKTKKLGSLRCYASLTDVKARVDLAIIVIPAILVPDVLEEAGRLGIRAAVIISAGFKESGNVDLENKVKAVARRYHITLLGPNCLGFINPYHRLNATFAPMMPLKGGLAFLSQSGALGTAILDKAKELSLGFSLFASLGNKAALNEADFLDYLRSDLQTKVVGIYAEQLGEAQRLSAAINLFNSGRRARPIIILKSGVSALGAGASSSHTGALAGNDAVYGAFFKDNNIVRAQDMSEFFDYLQIFYNNPLKSARRLAIITNAGGPGVLAADAVSKNNLSLSKFGKKTRLHLGKILPQSASIANPIDILGDAAPSLYLSALELAAADKSVQALLVLATPQSMTDIDGLAAVIIDWRRKNTKPLAVCLMGGNLVKNAATSLRQAGIAVFSYPEQAVRALSALTDFVERRLEKKAKRVRIAVKTSAKLKAAEILARLRRQGIKEVPEFQALPVLRAYNLPTSKFLILKNQADALKAGKRFHGPVALKIASYDILHKSEAGGVMLNVSPDDIARSYQNLILRVKKKAPQARIEGVLAAPMSPPSLAEIIVGSVSDESLGRALMLGWGGIYTEILKDVSFGSMPLNLGKIKGMLSELKVGLILGGSRGHRPADFQSLAKLLFSVERLLSDFPEIKEIDLNPVAVSSTGLRILDARLILS